MNSAKLGKTYRALKKDLDTEIARLEGGADGAAQAAGSIAIAKQFLADALSRTQGGEWYQAVKLLRTATADLEICGEDRKSVV